ncbi:MAG: T9SS type A sorting domain-containing protein [Bacteroidota bacterium]
MVDLSGKVVLTPVVNQGSTTANIDISALANGLYTIQIQTESGIGFSRLSVVK